MFIVARNTFMAFFHLCIPVVLAVLLFWCVKTHQADKRSKWTWLWADGAAMQSTANHPGHMPDSSISASAKMKTVSTKKVMTPPSLLSLQFHHPPPIIIPYFLASLCRYQLPDCLLFQLSPAWLQSQHTGEKMCKRRWSESKRVHGVKQQSNWEVDNVCTMWEMVGSGKKMRRQCGVWRSRVGEGREMMRGGGRHKRDKNDRGKAERTEMRAREENEILGGGSWKGMKSQCRRVSKGQEHSEMEEKRKIPIRKTAIMKGWKDAGC